MGLHMGLGCLALAGVCAVVAITSMALAMAATVVGVAFAFVGMGLVEEATRGATRS